MSIISLTSVGERMASQPSHYPSDAMRILYYLRRSGYNSSEEKLLAHFNFDKRTLNDAVEKLVANEAVTVSGG